MRGQTVIFRQVTLKSFRGFLMIKCIWLIQLALPRRNYYFIKLLLWQQCVPWWRYMSFTKEVSTPMVAVMCPSSEDWTHQGRGCIGHPLRGDWHPSACFLSCSPCTTGGHRLKCSAKLASWGSVRVTFRGGPKALWSFPWMLLGEAIPSLVVATDVD